jgi:hypothetical protein
MTNNKNKARKAEKVNETVAYSYTNIKPGNMTRRRKLGSLMDGDL